MVLKMPFNRSYGRRKEVLHRVTGWCAMAQRLPVIEGAVVRAIAKNVKYWFNFPKE